MAKVENKPISNLPVSEQRYSAATPDKPRSSGDILLLLAFSGGGTRAAALSYGILEELKNTHYKINGKDIRLLDEVDRISSVSGGSFTSAYYGLFGDQLFSEFKKVFLYKNIENELGSLSFDVINLVKNLLFTSNRTESAIKYYDQHLFHGKTFADFKRVNHPYILINASDLNSQSQFIFNQQQFDFLCSDLSQFSVARAVTASSAVPVLFPPVLIKRHDNCHFQKPTWLINAEHRAKQEEDQRLQEVVEALNFYLDKDKPSYVTLVDGGITDNLGLRTILQHVSLSGGPKAAYRNTYEQTQWPRFLAMIVVDASTVSNTNIGKSKALPTISDTLAAVTDIQLHLYNIETNTLLKQRLMQWAKKISTPDHPIKPYFIDLNINDLNDKNEKKLLNKIPTNFALNKTQVDKLIAAAKTLLHENHQYKKLLIDLRNN